MIKILKLIFINLFLLSNIFILNFASADNHDIYKTLESIKKDIKTLEKAVYSETTVLSTSNEDLDINSEDVLTRHLLKLSEVEEQFRELTNRFEEINFKLDKLSNRLSKIQADNQMRFQNIEANLGSGDEAISLTSKPKTENIDILPGSSQPQDLGSISYKDTETNLSSQQIQSVDTTATVITETFEQRKKLFQRT
jgi:TolA-binding protein